MNKATLQLERTYSARLGCHRGRHVWIPVCDGSAFTSSYFKTEAGALKSAKRVAEEMAKPFVNFQGQQVTFAVRRAAQ